MAERPKKMKISTANFRESNLSTVGDQYGGSLKAIASEPNQSDPIPGSSPRDILILHEDHKPVTEERFEDLVNHFGGKVNLNAPFTASVQIGKQLSDRVNIQLGKAIQEPPEVTTQAVLARFSANISPEVRSAVTESIYRSLKLLSMPVENLKILPNQRLPKHKLLRALRSTGWTTKNNYFTAYTTATLKQSTYRVVAYISNHDDVEQILMTFPGIADGEHSRFHNVKMQDLIRGIYSESANDEERQPLLNAYA